jgi:hypothetical protein
MEKTAFDWIPGDIVAGVRVSFGAPIGPSRKAGQRENGRPARDDIANSPRNL